MISYPVAIINLAALEHNFSRIKQLAPSSQIISVVKSNAYGHGYSEVVRSLNGSDAFAVARLSEGIQLREVGINHKIVLLEGILATSELEVAADYDLSPVFHQQDQVDILLQSKLFKPLIFCWLMLETGMHRLGFSLNNVTDALRSLSASKSISGSIGLMSHFANADLANDPRNEKQLNAVLDIAEDSQAISMANSASILSFPASHQDWLRPGLMLYGASPFADIRAVDLGLKPVMQLKSVLTAIQNMRTGDQVGYGGDWQATKMTKLGIVRIGYGDGYNRGLSCVGHVSILGKLVRVLGRVSMDMICIDLHTCSEAVVGDEVVLWGNHQISIEQVARQAKTIPYELMCQVSGRVVREYRHIYS
ncbi:MAG: alanine racemase [Piscirickettsiaceae bacterium]|nr:alanine racemase [Piscirickettsiaceae bacterium]